MQACAGRGQRQQIGDDLGGDQLTGKQRRHPWRITGDGLGGDPADSGLHRHGFTAAEERLAGCDRLLGTELDGRFRQNGVA